MITTSAEYDGGTSKVAAAKAKSLPCVQESFLDACFAAKKVVDPQGHTFEEDAPKPAASPKKKAASAAEQPAAKKAKT